MPLPTYTAKLRRLSVNTAHGRASPHKICMLLAVFDLARAGALPDNRILYGPRRCSSASVVSAGRCVRRAIIRTRTSRSSTSPVTYAAAR
jgi:hypothetical protein